MTTNLTNEIIEKGSEFDLDTMPDYHDRVTNGEFDDMSRDEIRDVYLQEAIDKEHDDFLEEINSSIRDSE